MATITKQRVFNKAMINRFTEVIFIDEACPSTLDIDDWKILTQGGHTACDVKYKTDDVNRTKEAGISARGSACHG